MKTIKLTTEYIKHGVYHLEQVEYTEEQFKQMLQNKGGNYGRFKKCNIKRKVKSN